MERQRGAVPWNVLDLDFAIPPALHKCEQRVIATHDPAVAKRLATTWRMVDGQLTPASRRPSLEMISN